MNDEDFRRVSDQIASRTEQKLDDFIDRYERDQALSKEWREAFCSKISGLDVRLKPLEDLNSKLKTPLQIIGIILLAALGGVGISLWKWIVKHWAI